MDHFKRAVWDLLEISEDEASGRLVFDWYDSSMAALIVLNVLAVVFHSVASLADRYGDAFWTFEVFSVAVFTVDYVVRLWACTSDRNYHSPLIGRLRYALSPLVIVDLVSFLPFYLGVFAIDLRFLRVLRLFRLLRVLKLGRYSRSLTLISRVLKRKASDLAVAVVVLLVLLVLASSLMYYVEHDAQPESFSSIPAAMWWGVATFTTVGYGDICPVTPFGKVLGSVIAVLGIGVFALPAGILASGFSEERERHLHARGVCPSCGRGPE